MCFTTGAIGWVSRRCLKNMRNWQNLWMINRCSECFTPGLGSAIFCRAKYSKSHMNVFKLLWELVKRLKTSTLSATHVPGSPGVVRSWGVWMKGYAYGERAMEISKLIPVGSVSLLQISGRNDMVPFITKETVERGLKWGHACIEYGLQHGNVQVPDLWAM